MRQQRQKVSGTVSNYMCGMNPTTGSHWSAQAAASSCAVPTAQAAAGTPLWGAPGPQGGVLLTRSRQAPVTTFMVGMVSIMSRACLDPAHALLLWAADRVGLQAAAGRASGCVHIAAGAGGCTQCLCMRQVQPLGSRHTR